MHMAEDILKIKKLEHQVHIRDVKIHELEHALGEKQKLIDAQAWQLKRNKQLLAKKGVRKSELQRKDARIRELKHELNELRKNHSDIIFEEGLGYD